MSSIVRAELDRIEFRGVRLWDVCAPTIEARLKTSKLSDLTSGDESIVRSMFVSYVYAVVASERFVASWKPTLSFAISSQDPTAHAYLSHIRRSDGDAAIFTFDPSSESIVVEMLSSGETYTTALILPQVTEMRSDPRTWAPELAAIVNELLSFLGHGADLIPG
jgi:hypothetical protein